MPVHFDRAQANARRLRGAPTHAERALWSMLRGKGLDGLRFRRQTPLGRYVVDFCCPSERLVIEVDGGVHRLREEEDTVRDAWLASQGFRVIRVSNEAVLSRPNEVLDAVRTAVSPPIRPAARATFPRKGGRG